MHFSKAFDLLPNHRFEAPSLWDHREAAQLDPKFSYNENTTGSPRWCFFIIYNGNLRHTSWDDFWPSTFILYQNDLPERISSQVRLLTDDYI